MSDLLNLGCGSRFHPDWRNLDLHAMPIHVEAWNVEQGIPCETSTERMCYASHLLEHLNSDSGASFLKDCHRVLVPGGIIRIVVPDLEVICRRYLAQLDALFSRSGSESGYDWAVLELLDQLVRTRSGGSVLPFLRNADESAQALMLERWGAEAKGLIKLSQADVTAGPRRPFRQWLGQIRTKIGEIITGLDRETLTLARFRSGGEVHQWMYDRYSLGRLLERCGFVQVQTCGAQESRLKDWSSYSLDADKNGLIHKPDSLFMEAIKPSTGNF